MFEKFAAYITSQAPITSDALDMMRSLAVMKKLRRRQLLLNEGEVCLYKTFIAKGLLKTYRLRDDGMETILRFAPENSWTTDHDSFMRQIPSQHYIEALESTEVICWTADSLTKIRQAIPAFKAYSDAIITDSLNASYERIYMNLSYTSEEKYEHFVTAFPEVFRRVPLHMVASYLGVSRETLSRIRRK
ncbi:Crp/Fnr family transcriptional regulator [Chitinophaga agri]|uniref:Crp/Fnr family transcriptional regulator n=1 Tax=Chitinophaga agri TaxID=2703787 RepID=A0A6B9ZB86_9BACT|nr:Crp/Fnr family transcriptional regulator [Chitinophaga agri]QHS59662.1 Crp/Fnr family transcriptional regulator [Chitinophaga agri]